MKFTTIDQLQTVEGDDIHLRFGFDMTAGKLIFSIIVKLASKPDPREFTAATLEEVLAWLRFNRLSTALFNSPKFCRKYNIAKTDITENMVVLNINKVPFFYIKHENGSWGCSNDIGIFLQLGNANYETAKTTLGTAFMARYETREKELAEIARNNDSLKSELNATRNEQQNIQAISAEETLPIVDINNAVSSIA